MTHQKVKMQLIASNSARRTSFKKRCSGIMKKVSELSTLCGVEACAIVYGPYDSEPDVWPKDKAKADAVLRRFRDMPEIEKTKKMMNQQSFLEERIRKAEDQLRKAHREAMAAHVHAIMYQCLAEGEDATSWLLNGINDPLVMNELARVVDGKMKVINDHIRRIEDQGSNYIAAPQQDEQQQQQMMMIDASSTAVGTTIASPSSPCIYSSLADVEPLFQREAPSTADYNNYYSNLNLGVLEKRSFDLTPPTPEILPDPYGTSNPLFWTPEEKQPLAAFVQSPVITPRYLEGVDAIFSPPFLSYNMGGIDGGFPSPFHDHNDGGMMNHQSSFQDYRVFMK